MQATLTKSINRNAAVKTTQEIIINAPVEKVWAIFSDIDNWNTWQKDVHSSKIDGPFREGSGFDWKSEGLKIHSTLHTVEYLKAAGWSGKAVGAFAIHNWVFTGQDGHTVVTVEESMEGWLVTLLKKYFQSKLVPATQRWLTYLKNQSENPVVG